MGDLFESLGGLAENVGGWVEKGQGLFDTGKGLFGSNNSNPMDGQFGPPSPQDQLNRQMTAGFNPIWVVAPGIAGIIYWIFTLISKPSKKF